MPDTLKKYIFHTGSSNHCESITESGLRAGGTSSRGGRHACSFCTESTRSNSRDLMRTDEGCDGTFRTVRYNHGCRPRSSLFFSFRCGGYRDRAVGFQFTQQQQRHILCGNMPASASDRSVAFPGRYVVSDEPRSQLSDPGSIDQGLVPARQKFDHKMEEVRQFPTSRRNAMPIGDQGCFAKYKVVNMKRT